MNWVPEACTLPTAERPLRVAEFDDLFATAVRPVHRIGATELRIFLPDGDETVSTVEDLAARESVCCPFFCFDIHRSPAGTELVVRVPPSHTAVLDGLQARAARKLAEVEAKLADLAVRRNTLRAALDAGCDDLMTCVGSECCPLPFVELTIVPGLRP